jgi:hypothetical protein
LQCLGKLVGARLEAARIIEENEIQSPQRLRYLVRLDRPANDWRETLVQRSCVRHLFQRHVGCHRVRREHEHHGIGVGNQRLDALPPILEGINLFAVDQRFEAARFERRVETVRESNVLARIGDEDSRLRFSAIGVPSHH